MSHERIRRSRGQNSGSLVAAQDDLSFNESIICFGCFWHVSVGSRGEDSAALLVAFVAAATTPSEDSMSAVALDRKSCIPCGLACFHVLGALGGSSLVSLFTKEVVDPVTSWILASKSSSRESLDMGCPGLSKCIQGIWETGLVTIKKSAQNGSSVSGSLNGKTLHPLRSLLLVR